MVKAGKWEIPSWDPYARSSEIAAAVVQLFISLLNRVSAMISDQPGKSDEEPVAALGKSSPKVEPSWNPSD